MHLPISIFHGRWITLSSLAHTYVYDLHLIVPKFKAIRGGTSQTEFEVICIYDFSLPTLSRFLSFPENITVGSWQFSLP